jgi:phenylacetate-CoA ligase
MFCGTRIMDFRKVRHHGLTWRAGKGRDEMATDRQHETRKNWLETLERFQLNAKAPGSADYWSPGLDTASRDELLDIQNRKIAAVTPFLYENSEFYRRRFDRLGLIPDDIACVGDLARWPVVDKTEMMQDAAAHPPYGSYSTLSEDLWRSRGWMMFSSSGSTGVPRVFRYSQKDRELWSWANARALHAMGMRSSDTMFLCSGYGPHVFAWGVQYALARMNLGMIPGGGMDSQARVGIIDRFKPTILTCTLSYALHLGRVMQKRGLDPAASSIRMVFVGGEPGSGIPNTRARLENLWGARLVEFYGCTEASPHAGGYSCPASGDDPRCVTAHLMEDTQVWELVGPDDLQPVPTGAQGLTVCTNLNSESSPQLRFLVGDYTVFNHDTCACGRTHVRAMGAFSGRSDDLINLRGIKMYPTQIEQAVRAVKGIGDEYEVVISTDAAGLDVMNIRVEHCDPDVAGRVASEVRARCEVRVTVEVLPPDTLPKTELKAKRVSDQRR